MKLAIVVVVAFLAVPAIGQAAVFTSQRYSGETTTDRAGPFSWSFISEEPVADAFGGVAYRLSTDDLWHRCLQSGSASLANLQPGRYTIMIADDYSPSWMREHGLQEAELCSEAEPAGGNETMDALNIATEEEPSLPLPVNEVEPFLDRPPAWVAEAAPLRAAELTAAAVARRAAEQAAREAQERAQAAVQPASPAPPARPRCVVPALARHSLHEATRRLLAAHCALGHVASSRRRHGQRVVVWQSAPSGRRLAGGAPIALELGGRRILR